MRYACAYTSVACLILAVSLIASVFPADNTYYGLSNWWLLLGWLASAAFHFVGITSLAGASQAGLVRQKVTTGSVLAIWLVGVSSCFVLFKGTYEEGLSISPGAIELGIYTSPGIALTSALLPALAGLHFKSVERFEIARKLFITAGCLLACASAVCGLYLLVWLDWSVGIDLYLSQPGGYTVTIPYALKTFAVLGACVALYGVLAGVRAFQAVR